MWIVDPLGPLPWAPDRASGELQSRGVTVFELAAAAGVAKLIDGLEVGEGTEALEPGVSPRARGRARRKRLLPRNPSTLPGVRLSARAASPATGRQYDSGTVLRAQDLLRSVFASERAGEPWPRRQRHVPRDDDLGGVWRMLMCAGVLAGAGAVVEALVDKDAARHERTIAGAFGALCVAAGTVLVVRPDPVPFAVRRWPLKTAAVGAVPLGLVAVTGHRHSPLHALAAAGGGVCGAVYGRDRGRYVAHGQGVIWAALASQRPREDPLPRTWRHVATPTTFMTNASLVAMLVSLAYTARTLDVILHRLDEGRGEYDREGRALVHALRGARAAVLAALEDPQVARHPAGERLRAQALCAIARIHEDIAALRGVHGYPAPRQGRLAEFRERHLVREPASFPVPVATVAQVARDVLSDYAPLLSGRPVAVTGDQELQVQSPARLALVGAVLAAGVGNALRHSPKFTALQIHIAERQDGQLILKVSNDLPAGCPLEQGPLPLDGDTGGLHSLMVAASALGGVLQPPVRVGGVVRLCLTMPRLTDSKGMAGVLDWDAIYGKRRRALDEHAAMHAAMALTRLCSRSGAPLHRSSLSATWAVLSALAGIVRPIVSTSDEKRPEPAGALALTLALGVSLASGFGAGAHRGALSAWHGAEISRVGLDQGVLTTLGLTLAGSAGLGLSYWRSDMHLAPLRQIATLAYLPLTMRATLMPLQGLLETRDREAVAGLEAVEVVVRETRRMIGSHSPAAAINDLGRDISLVVPEMLALCQRLQRAQGSIAAAQVDDVAGFRRGLEELLGDLALVLAARAYPGEVKVAEPDLVALGATSVDCPALLGMRARLMAIAATDLTARQALSHQPISWKAERPVQQFFLQITSSLRGQTRSLHVKISPVKWPPGAADQEHPRIRRHLQRLEKIGVKDPQWEHGAVSFRLPGK